MATEFFHTQNTPLNNFIDKSWLKCDSNIVVTSWWYKSLNSLTCRHKSVVQLRFIHCAMMSPFNLSSVFLFEWWMKRWQIVEEVLMNYNGLYHTVTNSQIHMYIIASSVKMCNVFVIYQFKSVRMVSCWDLCACSWAVIYQYSCC